MGKQNLKKIHTKTIVGGPSTSIQSLGEPSSGEFVRPRRGRPRGANRIPLTEPERRARNAMFERQRRADKAHLIEELKQVSGCAPDASEEAMVKYVTKKIKDAREATSLDEHRRINENLAAQIASCVERLGPEGTRIMAEFEEGAEDANMDERENQAKENMVPEWVPAAHLPAAQPSVVVAPLQLVPNSPPPQPDAPPDIAPEQLIPYMFSPEQLNIINRLIDFIQPHG